MKLHQTRPFPLMCKATVPFAILATVTSLAATTPVQQAQIQDLESLRFPTGSIEGRGTVSSNECDVFVKVIGTEDQLVLRIQGGSNLGMRTATSDRIYTEWNPDRVYVAVDGSVVLDIPVKGSGIVGYSVTRYHNANLLGDVWSPTRLEDEASTVEMTPDSVDMITCSPQGKVVGDTDCIIGGPGTAQASYKCGWWIFSVDTGITCDAGSYACVTGCGYSSCRTMTCAVPPAPPLPLVPCH